MHRTVSFLGHGPQTLQIKSIVGGIKTAFEAVNEEAVLRYIRPRTQKGAIYQSCKDLALVARWQG